LNLSNRRAVNTAEPSDIVGLIIPSVLIKTVPRDDESEVEVEDFTLVEDEGAMELTEELLTPDEGGMVWLTKTGRRQERENIWTQAIPVHRKSYVTGPAVANKSRWASVPMEDLSTKTPLRMQSDMH